jgi:hypothetical protein
MINPFLVAEDGDNPKYNPAPAVVTPLMNLRRDRDPDI